MKHKTLVFVISMVLVAECIIHGQADRTDAGKDSLQYYLDKARWGDGKAALWLARCYRDGRGVKQDFLQTLQMGMMAEEYGGIANMDSLFNEVSNDNNVRVIYDANKLFEQSGSEDLLKVKVDLLLERDCPEGYAIKAILVFKQGKIDEALALCEKAIKRGCVLAVIAKEGIVNGRENKLRPEALLKIAEKFPLAYRLLGEHYAMFPNDSVSDVDSTVKYYRKADEHACIGREGAIWLLEAIKTKGIPPIDSTEVSRLRSLSRNNGDI